MVVLSLGTNLGDRYANMILLEKSVALLFEGPIRKSPLYETAPVGVDESHHPYLNRIVAGEYHGSTEQLLLETQTIETRLGRIGKGELAPRTADIDILLFYQEQIQSETLTIPHHALFDRHFEIAGVQAVVPEMKIPGTSIRFKDYEIPAHVKTQEIIEIEQ